jgi:hypothetical protein
MDDEMQQWLAELKARVQASGRLPKVARLEASPCDFCSRAARCGAEQLACTAFERFNAGLRWEIAPRVDATHERYQRVFGDGTEATKRPRAGYVKR